MSLEIQVQPHLPNFEILRNDWDSDKKEGYIEVDFGQGRIVGFHCHAEKLEFALQHIHAFGERCQELDGQTFKERMESLYHRRLFCDLHKSGNQENYVAIYKFDRLGKDLECVGHHFQVPLKMHKSRIGEEEWRYLKELAEMHQAELTVRF